MTDEQLGEFIWTQIDDLEGGMDEVPVFLGQPADVSDEQWDRVLAEIVTARIQAGEVDALEELYRKDGTP